MGVAILVLVTVVMVLVIMADLAIVRSHLAYMDRWEARVKLSIQAQVNEIIEKRGQDFLVGLAKEADASYDKAINEFHGIAMERIKREVEIEVMKAKAHIAAAMKESYAVAQAAQEARAKKAEGAMKRPTQFPLDKVEDA